MHKLYKIILMGISLMFAFEVSAQQYELKRAKSAIDKGEYTEGAKILRPLAESGNAEAQYMVAGLFYDGKGVIKSWEQAEKYYLLAAHGGHNVAAVDIFNIYAEKNQLEKGTKLLKELCEKNPEREVSPIGMLLGYCTYKGLGDIGKNELLGWGLMFRARAYDNKGLLEELKNDFYTYLLNSSLDNPMALCEYLGWYYWNYSSEPEWTISYFDDMILQIKSLPTEKQAIHFKEWLKHSNETDYIETAGIVLAIMYSEGIGTSQDMAMADACYSRVSNETNNLLANKGGFKPEDMPNFFQMVVANIGKRKERAIFEAKKANVQVTCNTPQTIAKFGYARWENGTLTVGFSLGNKAMNPSNLSADTSSGMYQTVDGKSGYGKVRYVGGDYIGGRYLLKKGDMAFVSIEIKNMPPNGELKQISVKLSCQYGKGSVTACNVVWNAKWQE